MQAAPASGLGRGRGGAKTGSSLQEAQAALATVIRGPTTPESPGRHPHRPLLPNGTSAAGPRILVAPVWCKGCCLMLPHLPTNRCQVPDLTKHVCRHVCAHWQHQATVFAPPDRCHKYPSLVAVSEPAAQHRLSGRGHTTQPAHMKQSILHMLSTNMTGLL